MPNSPKPEDHDVYVLEKLRPKGQFLFGEKNRMIRETLVVEFTN